jgi:hypothetical protein
MAALNLLARLGMVVDEHEMGWFSIAAFNLQQTNTLDD